MASADVHAATRQSMTSRGSCMASLPPTNLERIPLVQPSSIL
jgi:hypothetical protein